METWYEYRTSKTTVALFSTLNQAKSWIEKAFEKYPDYAKSLSLFKVTRYVQEEKVE